MLSNNTVFPVAGSSVCLSSFASMIGESGSMTKFLSMDCFHKGAMSEVLGDVGIYFDPEDANSIARVLRELVHSPDLRAQLAQAGFDRAQAFLRKRCTDETFGFLVKIAHEPLTGGNL